MANATDSGAHRVHGTDPQYLIEKIIRQRIYDSPYWKEKCFGLDAATLVDQAVQLNYCGGIYSEHIVPTPFLCLTLKLLQLSPPMPIILELLQQSAYKYVRLLAALHIRLTGRAEAVYGQLDGLLSDWRKVRRRREDGTWELLHVDELVDEMLVKERCCSVTLPRMAKREQLMAAGKMEERKSALLDMMDEEKEESKQHTMKEEEREVKEAAVSSAQERKESEETSAVRVAGPQTTAADTVATGGHQASNAGDARSEGPHGHDDERHRRRDDDRGDRRSDRGERDGGRERHRRENRSPRRQRDDRDDRRHGSSSSSIRRHHHHRDYSPSRSRSPDRDRRSRRRDRDDERERRHRDDRHHRRRRSVSSSRSRSQSPRHRSSRRGSRS